MTATTEPRLTSLAHGGGCGCKLSPKVLRDILAGMPAMGGFPDLLVGTESSDDVFMPQWVRCKRFTRVSGDRPL